MPHGDLRMNVQELIRLSVLEQRPVTAEEAKNLVKKAGVVSYIETSALTQKNMKSVGHSC